MTIRTYRLLVTGFLLSLVVVDRFWHISLFSMVPLVMLIPILLTWHTSHPLGAVLTWGAITLFLTVASPLIIGGLAVVPWVVRRLLSWITVDLSFSFLFILLATSLLQLGLIFYTGVIPWGIAIPVWLLVSAIAFVALVVDQQVSPYV